MGGCRCSYRNCKNATSNTTNMHFFHYPIKHKDRCKQWIKNACKPDFMKLPDDQLRNKVVCSLHFETHYFVNSDRNRLIHDAVPTLNNPNDEDMFLQVLPTNAEGTVFKVKSNMNPIEDSICTYSIKFEELVPSSNKSSIKNEISYQLNERDMEYIEIDQEVHASNVIGNMDSNKHRNDEKSSQEQVEVLYISTKEPEKDKDPLEGNMELQDEKPKNTTKENKYLRQIKRHNREIKAIKSALRMSKAMSILNTLRKQLPPTLYTAVSLQIKRKKSNFTPAEHDFIVNVYKTSPTCYEMLRTKYKWNLPEPKYVENLVKTRS